jgi:AmmeMemoRadiSam system protein B
MTGRARIPAVAGSFYPAEPARLRTIVETLLAGARATPGPAGVDPGSVIGLLVPHAGLVYSGTIAALSWALAAEMEPATIVLAGTDHQAWADGVGVWTGGSWLSPLGESRVDERLAAMMVALGPPFAGDNAAHLTEHSLEVQLPLLSAACPAAEIVPLAVSPRLRNHRQAGLMLGRLLAERRAGGHRILLVASSDMAHYPPADVCEKADSELLVPLLRLDGDGLDELEARLRMNDLPGLVCGLCGIDPVRVALAALAEMGAVRGVLLGTATSADAGGDPRRTVGYAAAAFI